jgi:carbamate kinase
MLQQEIGSFLAEHGKLVDVCSVVTQVVIDPADPAFGTPTKPIGRFYRAEQADEMRRERGWDMVEDAGRGYRRVVPSPTPRDIVEWPAVKTLVSAGTLVIATGGGGVPVVRAGNGRLRGVEAVIDKDFASQRLASLIGARTLVLLTEVDRVAVNFGTPEQRPLQTVSLDEIKQHQADGQFPPGSMGPKVQAAVGFLEEGGERGIITSVRNLVAAVNDRSVGTQIVQHSAVPETLPRAGSAGRAV